jgi:nucleotide-binding universal stress UspA family protein
MNTVLDETLTTERISHRYSFEIKKIVVALDLSQNSEKTATYAAGFARVLRASLILVHVFTPEPIDEFTFPQVHESLKAERCETEKKLRSLVARVRETNPDCDMEFRIGDPAEQVTLVAEDNKADLIVTASHEPGFLGRLFGLDQAERILHRAHCPVLVYHEKV